MAKGCRMELSRETLELLLENAPCGIFTVDPELRISFWNRAAEKITGMPAQEVIGRKCSQIKGMSCFQD